MVAKNYYKNGDHGLYSNRRGTPCGQLNHQTSIQNCGEDTVYEMFDHLLPNIVGPGNDGEFSSSLKPFSQVKCLVEYIKLTSFLIFYTEPYLIKRVRT